MPTGSVSSLDGSTGTNREPKSWIVRTSKKIVNALRGGEQVEPKEKPSTRDRSAVGTTFTARRRSLSDLESIVAKAQVPTGPLGSISPPTSTAHIFSERWLSSIQSRQRSEGRRTGSLVGCFIGAIGLIPLGPVLMILSGITGLLLGLIIGAIVDMNRARETRSVAERELRRLTYLVRFAIDQINRKAFTPSGQTYACEVIEEVILEFRVYIQLAHLSPMLRKKLLLLYSFIQDPQVTQCLWYYLEQFLGRLNTDLSVVEFVEICRDIFGPLVDLEKKLGFNQPSSDRLEIIVKLEQFLADPRVKQFNLHAVYAPTAIESDNALRALEAVVLLNNFERTTSLRPRTGSIASESVYMSPRGVTFADDDDTQLALNFLDAVSFDESVVAESIGSPRFTTRRLTSGIRRPFFQSFQDLLNFDLNLKHQMPVTTFEFRFLFEKEAEPLNGPGWELAVDKEYIKILKLDTPSAILLRAYATLPNQTTENVFYQIFDPVKRQSWDTNFSEISLVKQSDDNVVLEESCEILYCQLNAPFGVTPRDFLQYRKAIRSPNTISILMRSAQHPSKPVGANGFIRAESYISGYVIRQAGPDVKLFIMSQTDIKGLIPKWIVNMVAAKAPAQWVENLTKACAKVLEKEFKNDKQAMHKFLTDYVAKTTATDTESV